MPHEIMAEIHEKELGVGYHWAFWAVIVVVVVVAVFVAWRFWMIRSRRRK